MKKTSIRYLLSTYRLDQLYLPAAFWALFAIVSLFQLEPDHLLDMARSYLGAVVPLTGGIMAAYAILDDPALELRFSTPARAARMLIERLGLILVGADRMRPHFSDLCARSGCGFLHPGECFPRAIRLAHPH